MRGTWPTPRCRTPARDFESERVTALIRLVYRLRGRHILLWAAACALALCAAACGSSGNAPAATADPVSSAVSSSPAGSSTGAGPSSSVAPSASASDDDCGGAVARVTAAVAGYPEVTKVQTIAACHEVDIQTNLASGVLGSPNATKGTAICEAAAKVAYQGDVSGITVSDVDGHELAAGLKTADCIPG
jgi:hypothetical protein